MTKKDDFVHFHLHSDMSQLDGCAKIGDYVKRAKERQNPAIGFSDHGTMRGYYEELEETNEHGIKPIYGCEFYVANDMARKGLTADEKEEITKGLKAGERKAAIKEYEELHGIRDRWHLTVWAKNDTGMRNLFKLTSASWIEGFYYKPRIDLDRLCEYGEGLAVATGCLSSPVNDHVLNGRKKRSLELSDMLYERFRDDLWLELQPHNLREQLHANRHVLSLKERYPECGYLACQDAHYLDRADAEHHEVLLCIGTNDNLSNPNRFKFDGDEFHFRTRAEMEEAFRTNHPYMKEQQIKEACDNTIILAEQCDVKLEVDFHACLMPEIHVPEAYGHDTYTYMKDLCTQGIGWRDLPGRAKRLSERKGESRTYHQLLKAYSDRLKMELGAIRRQKYVSYFLLVRDLYDWVRKQGIACGPGRGSAAGSLVSFLLGITSVDPIEHGLIFERFISPSRIDMPDIDMDFEDIRRQEIIDHLVDKYGRDRVCQIATIGKLSGKQCLKDTARVLEVPYAEVNAVTASIVERSSGDERASQTIEDSFKEFKVCQDFNKKYPAVLEHSKHLEGLAKTLGIHAAGVVVGPEDLTNIIALETRTAKKGSSERVIVSALDMYGCAAFGLLKLDVLGLRTMTVLRMACQAAGFPDAGMLEELPLDDPKVLQGFTDHDYVGIFQYDSPGADKICSGVEFVHFEDIAAMTALNRPGTARSGLATQYVERKKNPKLVSKTAFHPKVSEITSDTLGIIVYQEHVLKIFTEVAGFTPGTADSLRKTIAKKIGDETLGKERENFIKGAVEKTEGMDEKTAAKIMDAITFFGSYGFNKTISHNSYVLRAGTYSKEGTPWITVGELAKYRDKRDENGQLTPIAKKMRNYGINIIQMDDDGRCRPGKVVNVHDHGVVPVFQIETEDGHMTPEISESHRLMTVDGYKCIKSGLGVGDSLLFMGEMEEHAYCSWWQNPEAQRGRQSGLYKATVESVWVRAQDKCEECGKPGEQRRGGHEVAHTKTPEQCDYNETAFHSEANLKLLCNSCHKKLDYAKGERTKRWRKGRPTFASKIKAIHFRGEKQCFDLEMDTPGHNFVATPDPEKHPPVVSHNSHATSYGIIAYWGMWLKAYHPLEFYWALMVNEPERLEIQRIAKDAKSHDIQILPPDINVSREQFTIDREHNAIRGSLVDIKNVGIAACTSIVAGAPYKNILDFLKRVDRRKCNKRVVYSLAQAGALDNMLPNSKWFVENIDVVWKLLSKATKTKNMWRDLGALLVKSAGEEQYTDEDRMLVASSVNPLAFGKHPMEVYEDFIHRCVGVPIDYMARKDFFDRDHNCWVAGVILEVKYNQVGDFHTGELPDEAERERMGWGKRYANVNVEDASGKQNRIKVDWDIFDDFRHIVDLGPGTPVILHATANARFENMRAHALVHLEEMRQKEAKGVAYDQWERIVAGDHPVYSYPWTDKEEAANAAKFQHGPAKGGWATFTGVITNRKEKPDRKGNKMGFFGLLGTGDQYIDILCFGSAWPAFRKHVVNGRLVTMKVKKERGMYQLDDRGGQIKLLNKSAKVASAA